MSGDPVGWPTGSKHSYASVNAFTTHEGRVYIVCGHEQFLDTWELRLANHNPAERRLIKVGKIEKKMVSKDLFFEGTAIVQKDAQTMQLFATPWDYRRGHCAGSKSDEKCTHFWLFEKSFA